MATGASRLRVRWPLFLSLFLFLPLVAIPNALADVGAVQEDFEDDTVGAKPTAAWYTGVAQTGSAAIVVSTNDKYGGDKSLSHTSSVSNAFWQVNLASSSTPGYVEWAMKREGCMAAGDNGEWTGLVFDGPSGVLNQVEVADDGCGVYVLTTGSNPGEYVADVDEGWNIFRAIFDWSAGEINLTINGGGETGPYEMRFPGAVLNSLIFWSKGRGGAAVTGYYDDVGLDTPAGAGVPTETYLEPYDGQTVGSYPSQPWYSFNTFQETGGNDVQVTSFTPHSGDRALNLASTGINTGVYANTNLLNDDPVEVLRVEVAVKNPDCDLFTEDLDVSWVQVAGGAGIIAQAGISMDDCSLKYYDGDTLVTGSDLTDGWHVFRFEFDFDAKEYTLRVDGGAIASDLAFREPDNEAVNRVTYFFNTNNNEWNGNAFYDSLSITFAAPELEVAVYPAAPTWLYILPAWTRSGNPHEGRAVFTNSGNHSANVRYELQAVNNAGAITTNDDVGNDGTTTRAISWVTVQNPQLGGSTAYRVRGVDTSVNPEVAGPWSCTVTLDIFSSPGGECGTRPTQPDIQRPLNLFGEILDSGSYGEFPEPVVFSLDFGRSLDDIHCIYEYHLLIQTGDGSDVGVWTWEKTPCVTTISVTGPSFNHEDDATLLLKVRAWSPLTGLYGPYSCTVALDPRQEGYTAQCGAPTSSTTTSSTTGTGTGTGTGGPTNGIFPDAGVIGEQFGVDGAKIGWFLGLLLTVGLAAGLFFLPTMAGQSQGSPVMGVMGVLLGVGTSTVFGYFPIWFVAFLVLISMAVFVLMRRGG